MVLNVIALLMVLAIVLMQSVFGFFSGIINLFCSIMGLAVAFGYYEKVTDLLTGTLGLHPAYAAPCALIGLFIVAVAVLRTLADNYVRGNVRLPAALDWGGAALLGFFNAQIFVGVGVIAIMLLPVRTAQESRVLGFVRYERIAEERDDEHPFMVKFERRHLWTRSDEFTIALVNLLLDGAFSGDTPFTAVYPDFVDAVYYTSNTVQPESSPAPYRDKKIGDGFLKGLATEGWWLQKEPLDGRYATNVPSANKSSLEYERQVLKPAPGKKLIGVKVILKKPSADRDKRSLTHVFRPTMIRLVGRAGEQPQQYYPRALANADEHLKGALRIVDPDSNFAIPASGNVPIYAYFEVDEEFQPSFVEYRRFARAEVGQMLEEPPEIVLTLAGEETKTKHKASFASILESGSRQNNRLPFPMRRRTVQGADARIDGEQLVSGRIFGRRSALEAQDEKIPAIKVFHAPENKRIVQVRYKPKKARTIVGDVFNFVGQLKQYYAEDTAANRHWLAGYYAIVKRNNQEYIELFFNGDPDDPGDPTYRHMLDFKEIDRREISEQDDAIVGLIFVVPVGSEIRAIKTQSGEEIKIKIHVRR